MRALILLVVLLLAGTAFAALAPGASAFGVCTSVGVATRTCHDHRV